MPSSKEMIRLAADVVVVSILVVVVVVVAVVVVVDVFVSVVLNAFLRLRAALA